MRFALSPEQEELRSLARRFFETESSMAEVRRVMETAPGYDTSSWTQLARLGLLGLVIPEQHGGSGASLVEAAVVLREAGRALLPAPLLATSIAASALLGATDDEAAATWLPPIASGDVVGVMATSSASGSWELDDTGLEARHHGRAWLLDGDKGYVVHGAAAHLLLVTATTPSGIGLFVVPADAPGLACTSLPALDPTRRLASFAFVDTPARLICTNRSRMERALDIAAVCLAAEQAGGAERCLETAVDYAKTRVQFDRPIGSFQAIKHLLADVLVEVESARAAADYAAWAATSSPEELPVAASLAKSVCSDAYVQAASVNVQVHGGMGFTWEHDAHLHLKRAMGGKQLLGSPDFHRERLASAVLSPVHPAL
jgi:alkylation response protein AidB-like acyl-CoA dehydrogenase